MDSKFTGEKKMNDLMLDIETLGTRPTSVITQIGACYFDRYTGKIGDKFLRNVDVENSLKWGLTTDWNTIQWWFKQINKSWMEDVDLLTKILGELNHFAKKAKSVWSHATFDVPILMNAYVVTKRQKLPFHYRFARDIRTLVDLSGLPFDKNKKEKTHNALEDCIYQVEYCVKCFNALKENN